MKKTLILLLGFVLLQIILCQCTSPYMLVDYKEYTKGKLWIHRTYRYEDGRLVSKVSENLLGGGRFMTEYYVRTSEMGVDSIEMEYINFDNAHDTAVTVKSYNTDGILQDIRHYLYKEGEGRRETSHEYYDSKGRLVRDSSEVSQYYEYYDSLDRYVGYRDDYKDYIINHRLSRINQPTTETFIIKSEGDTVLYSWDGKFTSKTEIHWTRPDSTWIVNSKTVYEPDEKGRIVSDSAFDKKQTMEYVFDGKGRMRRMYVINDYPDVIDSIEYFISRTEYKYDRKERPVRAVARALEYPNHILVKEVWRYKGGHRTKHINYRYDNGRKRLNYIQIYKYGLFNDKLEKESKYYNRLRRNPVSQYIQKYEK